MSAAFHFSYPIATAGICSWKAALSFPWAILAIVGENPYQEQLWGFQARLCQLFSLLQLHSLIP